MSCALATLALFYSAVGFAQLKATAPGVVRSIAELTPLATIALGKTADWTAITTDAVWVGATGPNAVHRIDPATNAVVATVLLPGEPCAGLATGFGSLWVPLCGHPSALAKVDLTSNELRAVYAVAPAGAEGGVATSTDSVWLLTDKYGSLARIDPDSGAIRQVVHVAAGSYNPLVSEGRLWVTRADRRGLTVVDATTGSIVGLASTGPKPRFLAAGAESIWTLNQGDGTVTRVDRHRLRATQTIPLGTPGHGGDITFGGGILWTTMIGVPLSAIDAATGTVLCQWTGPGGDSLGVGHGAIWLTDYKGGTVTRFDLEATLKRCRSSR